jgi:hypothetical protein
MTDSKFHYWDFLAEGRFSEAVSWFNERQPQWTNADWREASARGTASLCLREYDKAAEDFALSNAMAVIAERHHNEGPSLDHEGGALWLAGKKEEGAAVWQRSVQGISSGIIGYADISGGISDGLLLWYAGVALARQDFIKEAEKFLKKASKRSWAQYMPGPLAHFVLHGKPMAEILQEKYGDGEIDVLENAAVSDARLRRELCEVLLCLATATRLAGKESECRSLLRRCASLRNPLVQIEWFLARGEIERH